MSCSVLYCNVRYGMVWHGMHASNVCMYVWMDGWINGWMDGWMYGMYVCNVMSCDVM